LGPKQVIGNRSWGINFSVLVGGAYGNNTLNDDDNGAVQVGAEILQTSAVVMRRAHEAPRT